MRTDSYTCVKTSDNCVVLHWWKKVPGQSDTNANGKKLFPYVVVSFVGIMFSTTVLSEH